ncbi:MAG: SRPBCC family protein [Desulfobacterales bacterium]|nr:MAG: SRPBCC family protein [Desulfobacterales bacterium]
MMKFENSVVIEQPVEKVFEFVTDIKNNPQWQTDILELAITSNGPFELGSTYRCVNRFMGRRIETEGVITDYQPDRACSFRITSGSVTGESSFLFEAVNGNGETKFTTIAELDLGYFKLGKIIVKRKIYQQLKNDMLKLKDILENGKSI